MSDKAIYAAKVKAIGDGGSGDFTALVSVFSNVDLTGDVVEPGAYADDVEFWGKAENTLPVIWSHQWHDPDYNVGVVKELEEVAPGDPRLTEEQRDLGGLLVVGSIDQGEQAVGSKAGSVWKLIKGGRVRNWSFHYSVLEQAFAKRDNREVRLLKKLHITEVGPTHLGANPVTGTLTAKAAAEALGLSPDDIAELRRMLKREPQTTDPEPVETTTHAADPRLAHLLSRHLGSDI